MPLCLASSESRDLLLICMHAWELQGPLSTWAARACGAGCGAEMHGRVQVLLCVLHPLQRTPAAPHAGGGSDMTVREGRTYFEADFRSAYEKVLRTPGASSLQEVIDGHTVTPMYFDIDLSVETAAPAQWSEGGRRLLLDAGMLEEEMELLLGEVTDMEWEAFHKFVMEELPGGLRALLCWEGGEVKAIHDDEAELDGIEQVGRLCLGQLTCVHHVQVGIRPAVLGCCMQMSWPARGWSASLFC